MVLGGHWRSCLRELRGQPGAGPGSILGSFPNRASGGFTLIELIVVMIIIGVIAGMTIPRMFGSSARAALAEAENVQRLLTIAAERDAYGSEPLALEYSEADQTLTILARRDSSAGSGQGQWMPDRVLLPVFLSKVRVAGAWEGGRALPRKSWRVVFSKLELRPLLSIQLESLSTDSRGAKPTWQITLSPEASTATRELGVGRLVPDSRVIDLDLTGKGDKSW